MGNALKTKSNRSRGQQRRGKSFADVEQLKLALKESEEKFVSVFGHNPVGLSITRLRDGIFVEINDAYTRFTGYTREQLVGHKTSEMNIWVDPDDRVKILKTIKETGRVSKEEHYFRNSSGEAHPVLISAEVINFGGEECLLVMAIDITKRKKGEESLRFSDAAFKSIHESIIALDNANIVTYWNNTSEEVFGVPAAEAIGKNLFNILRLKEDYPGHAAALFKKIADKGFDREEMCYLTPTGQVWVDTTIRVIESANKRYGYVVTALNITERKKAEQALKDSEQKYAGIVERGNDSIVIIQDNVIKYVNSKLLNVSGYSYEEVVGQHFINIVSKEYRDLVISRSRKRLAGEAVPQKYEIDVINKNGEIINVEASASLMEFEGRPADLAIIRDITERKKIERALKESEEKFSKAFNSSANAVCITSQPDNIILEVNEAYTRFTGYTREEVIGHTTADLNLWVNDEELKDLTAILVKEGRFQNREFHSRHKSGEIRTALGSAEVINIAGKTCRLVVITDITQRVKAEAALKESEEKFSKAFNSSANAICISSLPDNRFQEINEAYTRFTGYTREEVIGYTAAELKLWVFDEEFQKLHVILTKEGRFQNCEFHSRHKSGEIRTAIASAEVIYIGGKKCRIVVITDITDRKQAEEALKCSEENYRNSLEESPLGIRIVDTNGETIFLNRALLDIYGYDSFEEFKAAPMKSKFTPEMYAAHLKVLKKMATGDHIPPTGETSVIRKDGTIRHLGILTKDVYWNGIKGYQLLYQDITERKKAESALEQALTNLELSNTRISAANKELEAFSYSVSHDLRSPLRSIDGFSQALLEDYEINLDETGKDYLRRLRNASQKMGELIDGMLRLSRLSRSELRKEIVDLGALAREISNRLRETQPEREAEFIIGGDLTAEGDPQLLRALLENLLGNAWKFTGKKPRAIIEFGCVRNDSQKTFYVRDNGAGFDMAGADKLFGVFQRLHDAADFPGTGIGLATVQRIVSRHGGTVRAEGVVDQGAAFYFTLG